MYKRLEWCWRRRAEHRGALWAGVNSCRRVPLRLTNIIIDCVLYEHSFNKNAPARRDELVLHVEGLGSSILLLVGVDRRYSSCARLIHAPTSALKTHHEYYTHRTTRSHCLQRDVRLSSSITVRHGVQSAITDQRNTFQ